MDTNTLVQSGGATAITAGILAILWPTLKQIGVLILEKMGKGQDGELVADVLAFSRIKESLDRDTAEKAWAQLRPGYKREEADK